MYVSVMVTVTGSNNQVTWHVFAPQVHVQFQPYTIIPHCKACTVAHPVRCGCGLRCPFLICWSLWRWILNHHAKIWGCGNSSIRLQGRRMCIVWAWNLQRNEQSNHETVISRLRLHLNPLTTEFFPPRRHIFVHTTFVSTPFPQHSLQSGQTWWGPHTWRDLSGNTVNDIHYPQQAQQSEVKCGCQPDFRPAFP